MPDEIVALVAVTFLFGGGTLFLLAISPVGKALAARILGRQSPVIDEDELLKEMKELRREVDSLSTGGDPAALEDLRRDIDQLAERMDFAERLLAQQRSSPRLGGGS
jgi:hypothetical protein